MASGGWTLGFVVSLLVGCGSAESGHTAIWIEPPEGGCSDVARAFARSQGREERACGADELRYLNIVPVGAGHWFVWAPASGEQTLWRLDPSGAVQGAPLSSGVWGSIRSNHVLTALPGGLVFDYDEQVGTLDIWLTNLSARGTDPLPTKFLSIPARENVVWGITPVALDSSHVLEVRSGDGSYGVGSVRAEEIRFERLGTVGKKDQFRRGHRLVALGAERLFEWEPRTQSYRIWSYDMTRLPADPFHPDPIAAGTSPELAHGNEVLVLDEDRIAIWERESGVLRVRELDPLSLDPLAGRELSEHADDRFRSPLPGVEQPTTTNIPRLVIVFQDGRSFDSYFGRYCSAAPGSAPSCGSGPACCEAMPELLDGNPCVPFDDDYQPTVWSECIDRKLALWPQGRTPECGAPGDFACASANASDDAVSTYHALAAEGALADRYFASSSGYALANLSFFLFGFLGTTDPNTRLPTLGALLAQRRVPYALYQKKENAETWNVPPPDYYDGSWGFFRTLDEFAYDLETEQLPQLSVIVTDGTPFSEAPSQKSHASGIAFTESVARGVLDSPRYQRETLVLLTHLTSGGYYDHIAASGVPGISGYGARVPFLALGPSVRKNFVSHVPLEHVSLTAFVEWNFVSPDERVWLNQRDTLVNNLGSLFEPSALSVPVPSVRK